ncbi:MAG: TldD/PmbA family protein [Bacteriovoracia bacterium]
MKKTNVSENVTMGVVLRIFDGVTMYEKATDELEAPALRKAVDELVARVRAAQGDETYRGLPRRPYRPASWRERLALPLEEEIRVQVPADVKASTPVHFGIRFDVAPDAVAGEARLARLKQLLARCQELAPRFGLKAEDITYGSALERFHLEETVFIDREVNLSQTLYRFAANVTLRSGGERSYFYVGGLGGREVIEVPEVELENVLRDLHGLKHAERLKPGKYRVLFAPCISGVLAHEAFGHSQEGDTCVRGRSKAWDLYHSGELVGNRHATILNNPAMYENGDQKYAAWGSYFFDEEGWFAQEQVLLESGKLKPPMTNLTSAVRLGVPRTANGKRESWASGVYTRQTNTYFSPGEETYGQLLAQIEDGFLAVRPAGGMEDPKGMGIQVGMAYVKEVKGGKLTGRFFKGPTGGEIQMTGYTPEVLNSILGKSKIEAERAGPDQARFPYNDAGGCGKYHKELVFAGSGGPYMLMDQVVLG